jgi:UDP-glucose:(heptosyl)LPS alpha-1,3-glucosyltransferase
VRRVRARPGESISGFSPPILAAVPVFGATHWQIHSGLSREAFAGERESFASPARRILFWPAMHLNRFRSAILRTEERLLRDPAGPRLMVFSDRLRRRLVSELRLATDRVEVDRPGVDFALFHPGSSKHAPAGPLRLLFVAHNFDLKGLRTVFEALALSGGDLDASLTVVGGGPTARFRRLAARLGIARSVRFKGALPSPAVADACRAHDVLVHPTYHDPFPLAVAEALASGLPVVTTRRCGASEVVADAGAGLLVDDPGDAAGLLAAVRRLSDPALRGAMREAAIRAAAPLSQEAHFARVRRWLGLSAAV